MYLEPMYVNMINFKKKHRGKVVGILGGSWFIGPAVFAAVYSVAFSSSQNVGGNFVFMAVVMVVTNLLAAIFMKDYSRLVEDDMNEDCNLVLDTTDNESTVSYSPAVDDDVTGFDLCTKLDFHIMSWAFFLSGSVQTLLMGNVAVFLKSYEMEYLLTPLLISGPMTAAVTKITSGFVSDYFANTLPRSAYISVGSLLQTILLFFCISYAKNAGLFVITILITYLCNALFFSLFPALLSELFGTKYFSRNWGSLILVFSLFSLGLLAMFGAVYDKNVESGQTCYGQKCFCYTFIISSILSLVSFILISCMVWREKHWRTTQYNNMFS